VTILKETWLNALLPPSSSVSEAIENLNKFSLKIILVADQRGLLLGTVSDGDIRRGLLRSIDMNSSIKNIMRSNPLVVTPEVGRELILQLMIANKIQQIPVVDQNHAIVGLHLWDEITTPSLRSNTMVIMAGGKGSRLNPHTENCPKPLLLIAGKPMLEHIIERAKMEGFGHFVIAIHYLGHMIEEFFGDGSRLGVKIEYLREESPLGTAGALTLLNPLPKNSFLVTNGDVISDIHYGELLDFHNRYSAIATMAVRFHEWQHPFGVVQTEGVDIVGFEEKPINRTHINAGIYALNPDALNFLVFNEYCDMPSLFNKLNAENNKVVAYPMHEPWLDVGRPIDLQLANNTK
jgi:dTDP-glucose pyrophosphorylase/predicted transcriptional regulator